MEKEELEKFIVYKSKYIEEKSFDSYFHEIKFSINTYYRNLHKIKGNTPTANIAIYKASKTGKYNYNNYGDEVVYKELLDTIEPFDQINSKINQMKTFANVYVNNIPIDNTSFTLGIGEDFKGTYKNRRKKIFISQIGKVKNDDLFKKIQELLERYSIYKIQFRKNKSNNFDINIVAIELSGIYSVKQLTKCVIYDDMKYVKLSDEIYKNIEIIYLDDGKIKIEGDYFLNIDFDEIECFHVNDGKLYYYNECLGEFSIKKENDLKNFIYKLSGGIISKNEIKLKKVQHKPEQLIIEGSPGTGKSYKINQMFRNGEIVKRIVFYPEYENSNFIGYYEPVAIDGNIKYEFKAGDFTEILRQALNNPCKMHCLIIEEMTRGNCTAIFGAIFQLLDRKNGVSEYSIQSRKMREYIYSSKIPEEAYSVETQKYIENYEIFIPNNLSIYGTINSSDQNVIPIDDAFLRRFNHEYLSVEHGFQTLEDNDFELNFADFPNIKYSKFGMKLNEFIISVLKMEEDKQVGAYFIKNNEEISKLLRHLYKSIKNGHKSFGIELCILSENINSQAKLYEMYQKNEKGIFSEEFIEYVENE